jgi:hypothetical protein
VHAALAELSGDAVLELTKPPPNGAAQAAHAPVLPALTHPASRRRKIVTAPADRRKGPYVCLTDAPAMPCAASPRERAATIRT